MINDTTTPDISIVIPAFNEETRIGPTLTDYVEYFRENYSNAFEIIVVLNGCSDDTKTIVEQIGHGFSDVHVLEFKQRLGKGGAIWKGFQAARGRSILFVDADNMVGPSQADRLIGSLASHHVAIADRFSQDDSDGGQSLGRKIVSTLGRLWIRIVLGLRYSDTQCGAKALRAEAWELIATHIRETGWAFDLDLLSNAKVLGLTVGEVPVLWRHVADGSKVRMITAIPEVLVATLRIRYRSR